MNKHILREFLNKAKNCCYCDAEFNKTLKKTLDHFIPICNSLNITKSEINKLSNMQVCCMRCNAIKGNKIFANIEEVKEYISKIPKPKAKNKPRKYSIGKLFPNCNRVFKC
jgi:5-methylcytosine-specific restriction endonuclease McrA